MECCSSICSFFDLSWIPSITIPECVCVCECECECERETEREIRGKGAEVDTWMSSWYNHVKLLEHKTWRESTSCNPATTAPMNPKCGTYSNNKQRSWA